MFRKKRQFTHFERDDAGVVTDVRRYNVTGGSKDEPIPDLEPIDELEADTDVRAMEKEYKQQKRQDEMMELEAERSMLVKKREMKLEDLKHKKEKKELKSDIRKMRYAPLYKTESGLMKMGEAVRQSGDSGFAGGGQEKVEMSEDKMSLGTEKEGFFSWGRGGNIDWGAKAGGNSKNGVSMGLGKSNIDWGAKAGSGGKIDFSLGLGKKSAPKKRKKSKKKNTISNTKNRRKK